MKLDFIPYSLPEIKNIKTLIHVNDLARALLFISLKPEASGNIYNVTDNKLYSTTDICEYFAFSLNRGFSRIRLPLSFIKRILKIAPQIQYRFSKLYTDQAYSSEKIVDLGFRTKLDLSYFDKNLPF